MARRRWGSPKEFQRICQFPGAAMRTRFGHFILESETRRLLRDGQEIHLSPKAFDLLCALLARRPGVVPKTELLAQIWPKTFVLEANLNVLIGEIRRALGDDAQDPRFVRTAHGVGYAFCGDATDAAEASDASAPAAGARFWLVWRDRTFVLTYGDNTIGRDPGCRVWLDHSGVSRHHARIHIEGDTERVLLDDLESTNGTFVGRQRVVEQTPLGDGDVIEVGSVQLKFRAWSDKAARTKRLRTRS